MTKPQCARIVVLEIHQVEPEHINMFHVPIKIPVKQTRGEEGTTLGIEVPFPAEWIKKKAKEAMEERDIDDPCAKQYC